MKNQFFLFGMALFVTSCSSSVDVDAADVLPGSWLCNDGIVITFNANGRYEWRVPPDSAAEIHIEGSDQIRMHEDGGYSILDKWRVTSGRLEMDMFGESDWYDLDFKSESAFRMAGPDTFSCRRE